VRASYTSDSRAVLSSRGYWNSAPCPAREAYEGGAIGMSLRVGVLGSTRGTALQGVLAAVAAGTLDVKIVLVVSDKQSAPILERAVKHGVRGVVSRFRQE